MSKAPPQDNDPNAQPFSDPKASGQPGQPFQREFDTQEWLDSILNGMIGSKARLGQTASPRCEIADILREVHLEVHKAQQKHEPMNSAHEAYAVLKEEVDEYWAEVKADRGYQLSARNELIQIAAMAIRAINDTDPG